MANNLTGDFDVIAQFALPAVNRILAAMHRVERFPHSLSMRVDDTTQPGRDPGFPSAINVIDAFGDVVSDHGRVRNPVPVNLGDFTAGSPGSAAASLLDAIANVDLSGLNLEPLPPSQLKGKAQLQISPPTIEVNDSSGNKVTVRMEVMSRYIPDYNTPRVAEFVRGDLRITAAINQVASQVGNVVSIDVKANAATINFNASWSSSPISAQDHAGVEQLIRNALRNSFLPSNATLPPNIGHMQFRTISEGDGAVAVMLDMDGAAGNPATADQIFLGASDGFAFGIGAEYVKAAFQPTLDTILQTQVDPVKFSINGIVHTWHITYIITLNSAALELENGKMVLVIKGHAHTSSYLPDFNFTVKQDMTIAVSGSDAGIVFGNASIDTSSTIVNIFKSNAISGIGRVRDHAFAQSGARDKIRRMLNAELNLGGFLRSLLTPARAKPPVVPLDFTLTYESAEIRTTGIVLHGNIGLPIWPPARAEYEVITPSSGDGPFHDIPDAAVSTGPDYSALRSWIPGGTIESYEWHRQGASGYVDSHRFVLLAEGPSATAAAPGSSSPVMSAYSPMCLTVRGRRISSSGAFASTPVAATICGYRVFPVGDLAISDIGTGPLFALARRGNNGQVEILGHAAPAHSASGASTPNLLIHFADERSGTAAASLPRTVREAGRSDAATAVLLIAKSSQLATLAFSDELTYAEDDGSWRKRLGIAHQDSATVLVNPSGKVVWKKDGRIDTAELAAALKKSLEKTAGSKGAMLTANIRVGQPAPNFLFGHAPGNQVTLRKLAGREIVLVFFTAASKPSVDEVRDAATSRGALVLAIGDGKPAKENTGNAIFVADPDHRIAAAYGIRMWPTTVTIDEHGMVRGIATGRLMKGEQSRA